MSQKKEKQNDIVEPTPGPTPTPVPGEIEAPVEESAPPAPPQAAAPIPETPAAQQEPPPSVPAPPEPQASISEPPAAPPAAQQETPPSAAPPMTPPPQPEATKTVAQIAKDMNDHDLQFQMDLARGTIKPKTYGDLFYSQDTPARIGTLFGLLLSGVGSGLSHQPNAVMEMMNKEIANDLEAQKHSNENTQNWYKLSQAHELQQQTIAGLETTRQGVDYENVGKAAKAEQEVNLYREHNKGKGTPLIDAAMNQVAANNAANKMRSASAQSLQDNVNKLAPGPMKDRAQGVMNNQIYPGVQGANDANNKKSAAVKKIAQHVKQKATDSSPVRYDILAALRAEAQYQIDHGYPPKITPAEIDQIQKVEGPAMEQNLANTQAYIKAYKEVLASKDRGAIDEKGYDALTGRISDELAKNLAGGRLLVGEANINAGRIFPTWNDFINGRDRYKFDTTMKSLEAERSKLGTLRSHPEVMGPMPKFDNPYQGKKSPADENGRVRMMGPDGSVKLIPKENVKNYLDKNAGFKVLK